MAANAIASGAAIITANADGLASGLGKASADLKAWGHSTGGELKSTLASSIGGASGGSGFGGAISGMLTKIPPVAALAAAGLAGLGVAAHTVFDTLNDLAATNKAADVLGVSASQYAGMQKVLERVGVEGGDVTTMFAKMGKNILDSTGAAEQFSKMGIDVKALRGANLAEQFKTIATGFQSIPRGAEQAQAALDIFGKSGATLLPILQKGKEGIDELIDGESFEILSDKQYAAAGEAVKAWKAAKKDITGAWDGLVAHASVAFAPVVSFIGKSVSKIMAFLQPVFDWWGRAWEAIGTLAEGVFTKLGEWADRFGQWIMSLVDRLGSFGDGWWSIEKVIAEVFRAIGTIGGYAFDVLAIASGHIIEGLVAIADATDFIVDALVDLIHMMAKVPGAPDWFKGFDAGLDESMRKGREMRREIGEWAKDLSGRKFGKGADDFNEWLNDLLNPKKPKDKPKPQDEPIVAAASAFEPVKFASAIERGSKEAYSIEMKSRYGDFNKPENNVHKDNGKKLDTIVRVLQEQTAEQKEYYRKLAEEEAF